MEYFASMLTGTLAVPVGRRSYPKALRKSNDARQRASIQALAKKLKKLPATFTNLDVRCLLDCTEQYANSVTRKLAKSGYLQAMPKRTRTERTKYQWIPRRNRNHPSA